MSLDFAPLPPAAKTAAPAVSPPDDDFQTLPVPDDAVPIARHSKFGDPAFLFRYFDLAGNIFGYVARYEPPEGRKQFVPWRYGRRQGCTGWHPTRGAGQAQPYGLQWLQAAPSDPPVIVTEGEKKALGVPGMFPGHVGISPMGGAKAAHRTDWSCVRGRHVIVWPDNDPAGREFATKVAQLALDAGAASAGVVDVPAVFPAKWDLADPLPDSVTVDDLRALLPAAKPWRQSEPACDPGAPALQAGHDAATDTRAADSAPRVERQGDFLVARDWFKGADGEGHGPGVYRVVKRSNPILDAVAATGEGEPGGPAPLVVETLEWLCSPLEVVAITRDGEGTAWGRLLEVTTPDGQRHEWAMPNSMLAGDGKEVRAQLAHLGLQMPPGKGARDALNRYLTCWKTKGRARCVDRVGWHGPLFVLPDANYGHTAGERTVLQAAGADPEYRLAGSMESWQEHVARRAMGNSRLVLGICAALAGPLLHVVGEESGGVHLHGGSSIGKTTGLDVARSVWGVPRASWRTTDNGAEGLARAACDTFLPLDEIGQGDPRAIEAMAYLLGNGRGKARANVDGTGRPVSTWRTVFLSTGEVPLGAKLAEGGKRPMAGQAVRMVEVPADAGRGHGMFEDLHGFATGDALSRHLKDASDRHCGHAGRAFVECLAGASDAARDWALKAQAGYADAWTPPGADGQVRRAAGRFALLAAAGELGIHRGILPWPAGEAARGMKRCFDDWLRARGGHGPAEEAAMLAQVRAFVEAHGASRFETLRQREGGGEAAEPASDEKVINRAGYRKKDEQGCWTYHVLPQIWREAVCRGFDPEVVAKVMLGGGWLAKGDGNKLQCKVRIPGTGAVRVYTITPEFMADGSASGPFRRRAAPMAVTDGGCRGFAGCPTCPTSTSARWDRKSRGFAGCPTCPTCSTSKRRRSKKVRSRPLPHIPARHRSAMYPANWWDKMGQVECLLFSISYRWNIILLVRGTSGTPLK